MSAYLLNAVKRFNGHHKFLFKQAVQSSDHVLVTKMIGFVNLIALEKPCISLNFLLRCDQLIEGLEKRDKVFGFWICAVVMKISLQTT